MSTMLTTVMICTTCNCYGEALTQTQAPQGQLTLEAIEAFGATAYLHDDHVTFLDGACTEEAVRNMDDAELVVDSMKSLLGVDDRSEFIPWRTLTDASHNCYYVFQQMYAETTVPGGAIKVVTDENGTMLGLVASVESELPDYEEAQGITAEQAEEIALAHMLDTNSVKADLEKGATEMIVLPLRLDIDPYDDDDKGECRFVWAVYTTNPQGTQTNGSELPYLAHYVTMNGEYLYSLPAIRPGDEASTSGYNAAYVFEFMEPVDYTGKVTLSDGTEQEINVSLMRDTRTGMYYLGNIERRIAVADCYDFLYNEGSVKLEASPDNTGWDDTCLLSLYNYCRAWDYYQEIGWTGGDGEGTPILILKDYCNSDHEPIDNAAYAGKYNGWQIFLSSDINDFSQCLDVLCHEFTHCVTGSVMTYNAYMNDYGAINEAMSDIQGNICEMMMGATEDKTWLLGETSSTPPIRSMSEPNTYNQPGYIWDLHYIPNVKEPTDLNDRGGVHSNSSLLNNIAYRLCTDGGMTLEEARAFWFAVDCAMVPGTDYPQQSELMPWVLKTQGMEAYTSALESALDATRLRTDEIPDTFDKNRAMVTLSLPEQESFADGNWMLSITSVNVDPLLERVEGILTRKEEYTSVLDELMTILGVDPTLLPSEEEIKQNPDHAWDAVKEELLRIYRPDSDDDGRSGETKTESVDRAETGTETEAPKADRQKLQDWIITTYQQYFSDVLYSGSGAAGQDGHTVRMVCQPGVTIPILLRLELDTDHHIQSAGLAVYTFGRWNDVGKIAAPILQEIGLSSLTGDEGAGEGDEDFSWLEDLFDMISTDTSEKNAQKELPAWMNGVIDKLSGAMSWFSNLLFYQVREGEVNEIPATGLENVEVLNVKDYPFLDDLFNAQNQTGDENTYPESALLAELRTDIVRTETHEDITWDLIFTVENNESLKELLEQAISQAKEQEPDPQINPVEDLESWYDLIDRCYRGQKEMTSEEMDEIDQNIDCFFLICGQPLKELEKYDYLHNSLIYHEPFRSWLINYLSLTGSI